MLSKSSLFFVTFGIASLVFILAAGCGLTGSDATITSEAGPAGSACDGSCILHLDSGIRDGARFDVDAGPRYPDGSAPATSTDVMVLAFDVVDAKQSAALDAIVLISKTPSSALHILHTGDGTIDEIALPSVPTSLALDPTGKLAVVGHHMQISYVDLVNHTVTNTCNVSFDVATVALDETPIAYAVPRVDQWVSVHQVDLGTCVDRTVPLTNFVRASSPMAMHPSGAAFFVAGADLANELTRCVLGADAGLVCNSFTPDSSQMYQYCGRLWLSPDGNRMYTGCGVVLAIPVDVTVSRPQYGGTIGGLGDKFLSASWATSAKKVVVQPAAAPQYGVVGDLNGDTVVRVFDDVVLTPLAALRLPMMPAGAGQSVFARGKFVFTTPSADKFFVIVQADAPSLAFAFVTLTP